MNMIEIGKDYRIYRGTIVRIGANGDPEYMIDDVHIDNLVAPYIGRKVKITVEAME